MDRLSQEERDRIAVFPPEFREAIVRDIIRMRDPGNAPPAPVREEPLLAQAAASFGGFDERELKDMEEEEAASKKKVAEQAKKARNERSKLPEKRAHQEDDDQQDRRAKEPRLSEPSTSIASWIPSTSIDIVKMMSTSKAATIKAADALGRAAANARSEVKFQQGGFTFEANKGHILESSCKHPKDVVDSMCLKCKYKRELNLAELPEMVFPRNRLTILFGTHSKIEFNTLDALKLVCANALPDVKVAPSAVWQSTRTERIQQITEQHKPFDWTYTTHYKGTVAGCTVTPTEDRIDMERLKQRDEIVFNSSITLFEDELADHGTAQLSVRVRVMSTGYFFVLLRFYLRVDNVLIRVCDTRIVGNNGENRIHREWQRREAKYDNIRHIYPDDLLNPDTAWSLLPIEEQHFDYITAE